MFPCLIVDRSQEGFRLRGNFSLRRGQIVELIADDPEDSVRCEVIWVGRAPSPDLENEDRYDSGTATPNGD